MKETLFPRPAFDTLFVDLKRFLLTNIQFFIRARLCSRIGTLSRAVRVQKKSFRINWTRINAEKRG